MKIKEYKIIENNKDVDNMYMIIDTLNIFYKKSIKNSVDAINVVLTFFEDFSLKNNIKCGNLYVVKFNYDNNIYYYGVCDGMTNDYTELVKKYGTDFSEDFQYYCEKNGLDTDYNED